MQTTSTQINIGARNMGKSLKTNNSFNKNYGTSTQQPRKLLTVMDLEMEKIQSESGLGYDKNIFF